MLAEIACSPVSGVKSSIARELEEEFKHIIENEMIFTKFHPIVCLTTGDIIAYEALSRGPEASIFESPAYLFEMAEKLGLLHDLDMLCRKKALFNARTLGITNNQSFKLFINIDAACINDTGKTKILIEEIGLDVQNVVLEITERTFIKDSLNFYQTLKHYQSQGFSIAIDDFGSGSAGLRLISQISPQIVKIDKFLIEGIDQSFKKQEIIKTIVKMCQRLFGSEIVAEGIETLEELRTVKKLGIDCGQGFIFGKPSFSFRSVPPGLKRKIVNQDKYPENFEEIFSDETKIGDITTCSVPVFNSDSLVSELVKTFQDDHALHGIPIVDNGVPVGIVMKYELFLQLGKRFGFDLFHHRSVSYVMNKEFLMVDANWNIDLVADKVLSRDLSQLYDSFIMIKDRKYYGIASVHSLLEKMTDLKMKYAAHSNPLTGLPGNVSLRIFAEKQLKSCRDLACVYLDIDNFKSYNDYYGFCRGDEVIRRTADLMEGTFKSSRIGYIGHVGGDDFVAFIDPEEIEALCGEFIQQFEALVPTWYDDQDVQNGYIDTFGRKNEKTRIPMMTISIAVVKSTDQSRFQTYLDISRIAMEVKKKAKSLPGSVFYVDQRKTNQS